MKKFVIEYRSLSTHLQSNVFIILQLCLQNVIFFICPLHTFIFIECNISMFISQMNENFRCMPCSLSFLLWGLNRGIVQIKYLSLVSKDQQWMILFF